MKIPEGVKNILCVCTGGKDRSPVMAEYFRGLGYEAKAVGISEWHTSQNGTKWCDAWDLIDVTLIVCVSTVHEAFIRGVIRGSAWLTKKRHIRVVKELADETRGDDVREWVLGIMREAFPAKEAVCEPKRS